MLNRKKNEFGEHRRERAERILAALLALLVWQIAAELAGSNLLFAGPAESIGTLLRLAGTAAFWKTVGFTLLRITAGLAAALLAGTALAIPAARFRIVEVLLRPYMTAVKAVPVASFVILCLLWMKAENLSIVISFLIVLPLVYTNILTGLHETEPKLLEAAQVFRMTRRKKLKYIVVPSVRPYAASAVNAAVGMAWKAGTAAEVIGIPAGSVGEKLYLAKIYFDSGELFAWTLVIVLIASVSERIIREVMK